MKRYLLVTGALSLLCAVALLSLGRAQTPTTSAANQPAGAAVQVERDAVMGHMIRFFGGPGMMPAGSTRGEIAQLVNQLRDATDDAKKTELTKKLETAVAKHF